MGRLNRGEAVVSDFMAVVYGKGFNLRLLSEEAGVNYWKLRAHSAGMRPLDQDSLGKVAATLGIGVDDVPVPVVTVRWGSGTNNDAA